jgi:hypothetical protein
MPSERDERGLFPNPLIVDDPNRTYPSSSASLRKQIKCGDFKVGHVSNGLAIDSETSHWDVVLKIRPSSTTLSGTIRTDLYYELTGPSPEKLRELHSDEQVKSIAMKRTLPANKTIKGRICNAAMARKARFHACLFAGQRTRRRALRGQKL